MKKVLFYTLVCCSLFSCKKEEEEPEPPQPVDEVLTTYSFTNADYSEQELLWEMLDEISAYMETANQGKPLSKVQLQNMFGNDEHEWGDPDLNSYSGSLFNKLHPEALGSSVRWIGELEFISQNPGEGENDTAGIVQSNSGAEQFLFDREGFELSQILEIGTLGAVAYYRATSIHLGDSMKLAENGNSASEQATAMEHHWDQAFGYWGYPETYDTENPAVSLETNRFWAPYTHLVSDVLGSDTLMMNAFIRGREAIAEENYAKRDTAAKKIRSEWERVIAASAIHYLNEALTDFNDDALRNHQLSTAYALIWNLQFGAEQKLSDQKINTGILATYFFNFYEITVQDVSAVRDILANAYTLEEEKMLL